MRVLGPAVTSIAAVVAVAGPALAQNTSGLGTEAQLAPGKLTATLRGAKVPNDVAMAIPALPRTTKVRLAFGGQYGEDVLFNDGMPAGCLASKAVVGPEGGCAAVR